MPRIARIILPAAFLALSAGCAPSVGERLDRLEARTEMTRLYDLRIAALEDRVTLLEQDLGREKAARPGAAAPRKVEPRVVEPVKVEPRGVEPRPAPQGAEPQTIEPRKVEPNPAPTPVTMNPPSVPANGAPMVISPPALAAAVAMDPPSVPANGAPMVISPPAPVAPASAAPVAGSAGGAKGAYAAALALFEGRKYAESRAAFEAFAVANPGSPLMPNALYWQGECLYSQGDYAGAILKFKDVAGNYPTHHKAAAALLKAGYSYAQLGDTGNARFYWQMLLHDFPKSAEARLATRRMESGR